MNGYLGPYETMFGVRLRKVLEDPFAVHTDIAQVGWRGICPALHQAYESVNLWIRHYELEITGPKEAEIICRWLINPYAIEILNQAKILGCDWATEEEELLSKKRPTEPCLPSQI